MQEQHALIVENIVPGARLGRHIHFDERSRKYGVRKLLGRSKVVRKTTTWLRSVAPLDQKALGACTGNGAAGLLATAPYPQIARARVTETLAKSIYHEATLLDTISGSYPPNDTGSTVLAAMKALVAMKYATSYHWCFGIDDALDTLSALGPLEIGVNWYSGFDAPDANGLVKISGKVRGGHAFEVLGIDMESQRVLAINSWGKSWGVNGRFSFSFADFARLLKESGEAATIRL